MFVEAKDYPAQTVRVWLNEEDVTLDCFAADDVKGYVDCYRRNAEGKRYQIEDQGYAIPASERRYGVVKIELP